MRKAHSLAWVFFAVVLGCGNVDKVQVYPVEGKLFVSGLLAANAQLAFHSLDERISKTILPVGVTGTDGTFRLTTYEIGDGAPGGEYVVTIIWPDDSLPKDECADPIVHDRLNGRYSDPTKSQLHATIGPKPNEIILRATISGSWSLPKQRASERK